MNRLFAWFDRLIEADQRYACGVCDDRFNDLALAADHVLHCHPEFRAVALYDGTEAEPISAVQPAFSR